VLVRETRNFSPLGGSHQLENAQGRLSAFMYFFRLLPLLQSAAQSARDYGVLSLDWDIERPTGTRLCTSVLDGVVYVRKERRFLTSALATEFRDFLQRAYETMSNIELCERYFVLGNHLHTPFANPSSVVSYYLRMDAAVFLTAEQYVQAFSDLLEAVERLHAIRFIHRDIRWSNVMINSQANRFVLIDFDDGAFLDSDDKAAPSWRSLDQSSHAPGINEMRHGREVDLWSLAYLCLSKHLDCPAWMQNVAREIMKDYKILDVASVRERFLTRQQRARP